MIVDDERKERGEAVEVIRGTSARFSVAGEWEGPMTWCHGEAERRDWARTWHFTDQLLPGG
jgi:hypothetical protein